MERKTRVDAEPGKQHLVITRDFDLSLDLLFRAYTEAEFIEQWMGTKVLKLDSRTHGSYRFETTDPKGNKFGLSGVIHELIDNKRITRTFEMLPAAFGVQLEFYEFTSLTEDTSRLVMNVIYESAGHRDQVLRLPFAYGISMAHDRLEEMMKKLK